MKHQYKTEVLWKKYTQMFLDFGVDIYAKFFVRIKTEIIFSEPKKILFVTMAQLGDALIESYVFPFLKERYPNAEIDVLTSGWCKQIYENNPYVRSIIYFNHFRMNRSERSYYRKILNHIKTKRQALRTIRSNQYDLSIEGGVTHPNGNILCYRGRIKRRVGSGSGGFGGLLTDEVLLPQKKGFHILEALLNGLKVIGIERKLEDIRPYFTISQKVSNEIHPFHEYLEGPFVIIHPESGNIKKTINNEFWFQVVKNMLASTNCRIMFCGTSRATSELVAILLSVNPTANGRIIDTVRKLSLDELFVLGKHAKAALTVDSLAAHFCSINCNTISFYYNSAGSYFFPISNKKAIIIHNHLPSKDLYVHPTLESHFVENIDSDETVNLANKFILELIN